MDELKKLIEQRTGVPAALLGGETAEENIARAKALLAYREQLSGGGSSPRDRFAAWARQELGDEEPEFTPMGALNAIEAGIRQASGSAPQLKDGGEVTNLPSGGSTAEQFAEWFSESFS